MEKKIIPGYRFVKRSLIGKGNYLMARCFVKTGDKLGRNSLLDALGDTINTLLCGAGHNIRPIFKEMRKNAASLC